MATRIRIKRGTESQITGYTGTQYEGELAYATNTGEVFVNNGTQFISVGGSSETPTLQSVTDAGNTTTNDINTSGAINLSSGGYIYGDSTNPYLKLNTAQGALLGYGSSYLNNGGSLLFHAGGSAKFYVGNSGSSYFTGYLGIGTTAPSTLLHLRGDSPTLRIEADGANESSIIELVQDGGITGAAIKYNGASNIEALQFNTGVSDVRMTIKRTNGNVGIGTTAPTGKLHVVGTTSIIDSTLKLGNRTGSNGALILQGNNGPNFTIEGVNDTLDFSLVTGNPNGGVIQFSDAIKNVWFANSVGGTFAVRRANSANTDDNFGGIFVESQATTASNGRAIYVSADNNGGIIRSTSYGGVGTTGLLQFQVGGNTSLPETKMVMDASGNLGIGTTAPNSLLHVARTSNGEVLRLQDTTNANQNYVFETEATGSYYGLNLKNSSTGDTIVNFSANGKLGIKTNNPDKALTINETADNDVQIKIGNHFGIGYSQAGQTRSVIGSTYGNDAAMMSFVLGGYTTASDKMTILGSGNVGIGTTAPAHVLHINKDNPYIQIQDSSAPTRGDMSAGIIMKDSTGAQSFQITQSSSVDVSIRANAGDLSLGTFVGTVIKLDGSNVGIGTTAPNSKVHISGTAMQQLRMETAGGPSSSGDTSGRIGDMAYDNDFFYIKTANGWGRVQLDFGF